MPRSGDSSAARAPAAEARGALLLLPTALLLSGFASLVYQVVWVRRFAVAVGTTNVAVTLVLALFLGGLGLGAALAGRTGGTLGAARLARRFALLEAGAAAFALALPFFLAACEPILRAFYTPGAAPLFAGALAALFLLPAAAFMGATLPTLTALHRRRRARSEGGTAAWLYAANTAGALFGSILTARWLVPHLGLSWATGAGVAANLAAAALVLRGFGRRGAGSEDAIRPPPLPNAAPKATETPDGHWPRRAAAAAALSGFAALSAEVGWARLAALLFGPTIYTFACVVAGVILGTAVGSALAGRLVAGSSLPASAGPRRAARRVAKGPPKGDSPRTPPAAALRLALIQLGAGAAGVGLLALADRLVLPIGGQIARRAGEIPALLDLQFLQTVGLLLLPSALLGAAFPFAVALAAGRSAAAGDRPDPRPGRPTGVIYGWTAAGNAAGALAAGLLLIPLLGIEAALFAAVAAHLAAALLLRPRLAAALAAAAIAVSGTAAARSWDWELLSGGLYQAAAGTEPRRHRDLLRRGRLVFLEQGAAATVSVKATAVELSLAIDGKVDATDGADMLTQRFLAHLPLLLAPRPESVFIVGHGSGVTAGAALRHPVSRVTAAEISPEVAEASRLFAEANGAPWNDERFSLLRVDARNHLRLGGERYEVIISEPSNPWMSGVSPLFTVEFFEQARSRLTPGGLFCQWIHLYRLAEPEVQTVVGSFTEVFPETALFVLHDGDALLIGANGPFPAASPEDIRRRIARVADETRPYGLTGPSALSGFLAAAGEDLVRWAAAAPRHRDDRPILEFRAPLSAHAETAAENRRTLLRLGGGRAFAGLDPRVALSAADLAARAEGLLGAASPAWAQELAERALALDPANPAAAAALVRAALSGGDPDSGEEFLRRRLLEAGPDGAAAENLTPALARLLFAGGRPDEAAGALESGPAALAGNLAALLLAAEIQVGRGEPESAAELVRAVLREDPRHPEAAAWLAELSLRRGDAARAAAESAAILAVHPGQERALRVRAVALAGSGDRAPARAAFAELVRRAPGPAIHWANFAAFELESGESESGESAALRFREAVRLYREAVDRDPANRPAYEGMLRAALLAGDEESARRAREVLGRPGPDSR